MVRSYCGMVWNREALNSMVKLCPVKHGYVRLAKALLRRGQAWLCTVLSCNVWLGIMWSGPVK